MIFLAKLGVGVLGTALVGGAALSSEGFIHVRVHENGPDPTRINVIVPAAAVPMALSFVPRENLRDASSVTVASQKAHGPPERERSPCTSSNQFSSFIIAMMLPSGRRRVGRSTFIQPRSNQ